MTPTNGNGKAVCQLPKLYINGFPKSGTHMVERMAQQILNPAGKKPWLGTFKMNSWTNDWINVDVFNDNVRRIIPGYYAKGHCGYHDDIARAMYEHGLGMVFVYRNLRDVAISQAHHVLNENDKRFQHPCKELYRCMTSFEDVLLAVIDGYGTFPGIWQRWHTYAPWLSVPWVLNLGYEEVLEDPHAAAVLFMRYAYGRAAQNEGNHVTLNHDDISEIAQAMSDAIGKRDTATFRQGKAYGWKFDDNWTARVEGSYQAGRQWFKRTIKQELNDYTIAPIHQFNGHEARV